MASDPDISLILPAYNEARVIGQTIAEAVGYFRKAGLRHEIIVAADGSDGTREKVREMARENPALRAIGRDARSGKGRGIREAVELHDVELFIVACPKDVTMFEDAIKTSGNSERIRLRELTELLEEAVATPTEHFAIVP